MALPITVPYTFGNATTAIPLSNLDSDYATVYQAVNGIGNGSVALANVTITGGTVSNVSGVVPTPFTANGVVYASSTSALTTGSALVFDGSNLGLGVTPTTKLDIGANDGTPKTISLRYSSVPAFYSSTFDGAVGLNTISINTYNTSSGSTSWSAFSNTNFGAAAIQLASQNGSSNFIRFLVGTAANTVPVETARINSSGNLLVGTTSSNFGSRITSWSNTSYTVESIRTGTGSEGHIAFVNANGGVGSIFTNASVTLYNTTSDQRLKENIQDSDSASSLIDSLQVRKFDWKANGSHQRYGFVAQELLTVAPEAVSQPEDSEQMMAVDYSKLVPMLVKEIQSLRQRLSAANL